MQEQVSGYAKVHGGQLYYEVAGEGQPLVLIHAGVADNRMWDEQVKFFAPKYRVIRYDTRGYGKTTSENVEFSNRQDLKDLLTMLGIEKAYVVGLSRGGQIAVDFTLEFPDMVVAVVPVAAGLSGFAFDSPANEMKVFEEMEAELEKGNYERAVELEVEAWVDGFYRNGKADEKVREKVRDMCMTAYLNHKEEEPKAIPLEPPAAPRLSEIKVPALVIYGDIDVADVVATATALADGITGAKKVLIPGTAHMVNMEEPDQFNQALAEFLENIPNA